MSLNKDQKQHLVAAVASLVVIFPLAYAIFDLSSRNYMYILAAALFSLAFGEGVRLVFSRLAKG